MPISLQPESVHLDMVGVVGSSPIAPTNLLIRFRSMQGKHRNAEIWLNLLNLKLP